MVYAQAQAQQSGQAAPNAYQQATQQTQQPAKPTPQTGDATQTNQGYQNPGRSFGVAGAGEQNIGAAAMGGAVKPSVLGAGGWSNFLPQNGGQANQMWQPNQPVQQAQQAAGGLGGLPGMSRLQSMQPMQPQQAPQYRSGGLGAPPVAPVAPMAPLAPQAPPMQPQSLMAGAIGNGAGATSNAQQTQNFMNALRQAGAGSNNTFATSAPQSSSPAQNLLGAPVASSQAAPTYSYNYGLNPGGSTNTFGGLNPAVGQNFDNGAPVASGQVSQPIGQQQATDPTQYMPGLAGQLGAQPGAPSSAPQMGLGNGSTGGLMSDENQKTEIRPSDRKLDEFMGHLNAWQYKYKDKKFGAGEYVSPMAQELEKSELGKSAVLDTPDGKMVDYGRVAGAHLAASALMNKRILALESKMKRGK